MATKKKRASKGCGCERAGVLLMNGPPREIQKCDDCALFETDDDAANAVDLLLGLLHEEYERGPASGTVSDAFDRMKEKGKGDPTKKKTKAERALDRIAAVLSRNEWNSETCEGIAYIIRESGRKVEDINP